jgi:hypothetical protein
LVERINDKASAAATAGGTFRAATELSKAVAHAETTFILLPTPRLRVARDPVFAPLVRAWGECVYAFRVGGYEDFILAGIERTHPIAIYPQ